MGHDRGSNLQSHKESCMPQPPHHQTSMHEGFYLSFIDSYVCSTCKNKSERRTVFINLRSYWQTSQWSLYPIHCISSLRPNLQYGSRCIVRYWSYCSSKNHILIHLPSEESRRKLWQQWIALADCNMLGMTGMTGDRTCSLSRDRACPSHHTIRPANR